MTKAGDIHGRLTVVELDHTTPAPYWHKYWRCLCECGNEAVVYQGNLTRNTSSCGCLRRELGGSNGKRHGYSGTQVHNTWIAMRQRCENPNDHAYVHYGGRGITVCDEWQDFLVFLADMGERPGWATGGIDRVDNDGNYEPGNCRWATSAEQNANRGRKDEDPPKRANANTIN